VLKISENEAIEHRSKKCACLIRDREGKIDHGGLFDIDSDYDGNVDGKPY
jgi:hypothetical protein